MFYILSFTLMKVLPPCRNMCPTGCVWFIFFSKNGPSLSFRSCPILIIWVNVDQVNIGSKMSFYYWISCICWVQCIDSVKYIFICFVITVYVFNKCPIYIFRHWYCQRSFNTFFVLWIRILMVAGTLCSQWLPSR